MLLLVSLLLLVFFALVCYWDLKYRIIPDEINYGFLVAAIILFYLKHSISPYYFLFILVSFIFAYTLYKFGVWAGGDTKFFTSLSAFLPFFININFLSIFLMLLISVVIAVPFLLLIHLRELVKRFSRIKSAFSGSFKLAVSNSFFSAFILALFSFANSIFLYLLLFVISFFFRPKLRISIVLFLVVAILFPQSTVLFYLVAFSMFFVYFLSKSLFSVTRSLLTKNVDIKELKEGMIPAYSVYLDGGKPKIWKPPTMSNLLSHAKNLDVFSLLSMSFKPKNLVVDSLKARGLTTGEIKKLKLLKIKYMQIKESIPFAPLLVGGFILTILILSLVKI